MTRESESQRSKIYSVQVTRIITHATECATLRIRAISRTEAEEKARKMYWRNDVTFDALEVQDCEVSYEVEELSPEARIGALLCSIRCISAETTGYDTEVIIANIQGICRKALEAEKLFSTPPTEENNQWPPLPLHPQHPQHP